MTSIAQNKNTLLSKLKAIPLGRALLNASIFFLIICSYYISKPVRNSLILEWMGPETLPWVYLFNAVVTLFGAFLFEKILMKYKPRFVLPFTLAFLGVILLMFAIAFNILGTLPVLSFSFYVFLSFMSVVSVTLFWSGCNDSFTPNEGKLVYGLIGLGGIAGGVFGGEIAKGLGKIFESEALLYPSGLILILCAPLPYLSLRTRYREKIEALPPLQTSVKGLVLILKNPYVLGIAGIVVSTTLLATLFDFQYQALIKEANLSKNERTQLFANIFSNINQIALVIHLFITPLLLRFGGSFAGLLPMPLLMIGGTLALSLKYDLNTVIVLWSLSGGLGYSLNQVAKESLYLPAPREIKYQAKIYIDSFIYRFGDAIASIFLLVWTTLLNLESKLLLQVNFIFGGLWLLLVILLYMRKDLKPTLSK